MTSLPSPLQFGPYESQLGTKKNDKVVVSNGQGFYSGSGNDSLTSGSTRIDIDSFPGGYAVDSVVMSGGLGNDRYKFKRQNYEWGFVADGGGGDDIIKFKRNNIFNPSSPTSDARIDILFINGRDLLITSTNPDGGRPNGIAFSDPLGNHPTFGDENKIEKVKFGSKVMNFKRFFKKLEGLASNSDHGDNYFYQEVTYTDLNNAGVLNFEGIEDMGQLENGEYLGIGSFNNALVDMVGG